MFYASKSYLGIYLLVLTTIILEIVFCFHYKSLVRGKEISHIKCASRDMYKNIVYINPRTPSKT